jgi:divalent metal cation (Fe/Co/Zn/Cd) transporter
MAEALQRGGDEPRGDAPPVDPSLIALRYRHHRARRTRKIAHRQEKWLAHYRFYVVLGVLVAIGGGFVVATLHEIHRLFGL